MAPSKSRKGKAAVVPVDKGSESEETTQGSQGEFDVLKTAHDMVKNNKKRREANRKAIEREHEQRVKNAKIKIDAVFQAKKARVTKSQSALWDRLHALNRRRQDLEGRILASMKALEKEIGNISSELVATFTGRVQDIEDPSSQDE